MPNLRQLEYLVALADTQHFRRAAERTNTTQPTLSEQLKALEERLGFQLVERSSSGAILTPAGVQVVEIARRMLRDANEIRAIASFQNNKLSGYLRLAVPSTIGPYLFKYAAPRLHRAYPQLRLHVREDLPGNLFKTLADSQDDLIITLSPSQSSDIVAIPLFREPLNLVVGADDPLAKSGKVSLADLKGRDLLTLGPAHKLHDGVLPLCEEAGAKLRFDFEGTSLDMLREMVIMGLGVTFMPGLYTNRELISDDDVAVIDLEDRQIYRTIYMAWRKATLRAGSYEKLVDFFKKLPSEVQEMKCLEPA